MLEQQRILRYSPNCGSDNLSGAANQQGSLRDPPEIARRPLRLQVMIRSDLHGDMQRPTEMTGPPRCGSNNNSANWVLETVSTVQAKVLEASWGGESTTSTAMRTRIARDTIVGTGSRTAGNVQKVNQHSPANGAFFSTTYATLQPTILAGALFGTSLAFRLAA